MHYKIRLMIGAVFLPLLMTLGCGEPVDKLKKTDFADPSPLASADSHKPLVISTSPVDDATAQSTKMDISATFNVAMDPSTISDATFAVKKADGSLVKGTVAVDKTGLVATFNPKERLACNTTYVATIKKEAKCETQGTAEPLEQNFTWDFTTDCCSCEPAEPAGLLEPLVVPMPFGPGGFYGFPFGGGGGRPRPPKAPPIPPIVIATAPTNDQTDVPRNSDISVTFSQDMRPSSINSTTFVVTDSSDNIIPGSLVVDVALRTVVFTPDSDLDALETYTVTILGGENGVENFQGVNMVNDYSFSFTTGSTPDTTAPQIIATNPVCSATFVLMNQNISASFSEAMNPLSISTTTFSLTGPGLTPVSGVVSYDVASQIATFNPVANLSPNTLYTFTIQGAPDGVTDLAGNYLAADFVCSFTTGPAIDTTPPTITANNPLCGAINVPTNQIISATFSEAMNASTINIQNFTLVGPGSTPVVGIVAYDLDSFVATFTPNNILSPSTTYTFTVEGAPDGVTDAAGNYLASDFTCSFTTGAAPDTTPPTVASSIPLCNATGVLTTQNLSVTFSEAMDPLTISTLTFTLANGGPVTGIVGLMSGNIATFTPSITLASNTLYTFTVVGGASGVKDLAGNPLAADFTCSFTTGASGGQTPVDLDDAAGFVILARATITNTGSSVITGDLGLTLPGTSITGFPPGVVMSGTIHNGDAPAINAQADSMAAYTDAAGRTTGQLSLGATIGNGQTVTPGLYNNASAVGLNGTLTLDAQGHPGAVFIFQIGSTLITSSGSQVILAGGAQASNIIWQVGSSATLGTNSTFQGTILAATTITSNTGVVVVGRLFSSAVNAGAVSLDTTNVTLP